MKVVALVSGGKDSCYAMMECVRYGHEIVCLAHLHPPLHLSADEQEIDSFMYQSVGHNVVQLIADSMDKPLVTETITGKAVKTDIDYTGTTDGDEVEDLYRLLEKVKARFPEVQGVCSGAIFSSYQRNRVENVCSRLELTSLGYLWRRNQEELLGDMVDAGVEAILVKVAAIGLHPRKHLSRTIGDLYMELLGLQEKYELNVCGEGGEYETLTLDCPLFKKRIVVDASRIVVHSDDYFAPVAFLVIEQCHLEDKDDGDSDFFSQNPLPPPYSPPAQARPKSPPSTRSTTAIANTQGSVTSSVYPPLGSFRDQFYLSGVMAPNGASSLSLEGEMAAVFHQVTTTLAQQQMTLEDVCFVHLYVKNMDDFAAINAEYCNSFGQFMPPSRSCVELNTLPSRVLMDAFAIRGSGAAKLETPRGATRDVLHVKSISAWAPNCIGPYSQANILHKSLVMLAGQVAFQPQTMTIVGDDHLQQTQQAMRNAGSVLEALQSNLRHVCSGVVYVTESQSFPRITDAVAAECRRLLLANGGLVDTFENAYNSDESDEEIDKSEALVALVREAPLLVVQLSHLPRHALVEVELQALTHAPVKSLPVMSSSSLAAVELDGWSIRAQCSTIPRTLCHVVATASGGDGESIASACRGMLLVVERSLAVAELPWDRVAHLRVFYVADKAMPSELAVAQAIEAVLHNAVQDGVMATPALTFVPVEAMQNGARAALQVTAQDLDKLETDLWLRRQA